MANLNDQPINFNGFYNAFTGVKFTVKSTDCKIFVPNYKNLSHSFIPSMSGTEMGLQDEFTSQSFLVDGDPQKIDRVLLKDLWEYAENNILWDDFNEVLSFQDTVVEKISLAEFVNDIDTFLVYNKLAKFGNVWWSSRVSTDFLEENTQFANVKVPNVSAFDVSGGYQASLSFYSIDKQINDEYKKYAANPLTYSGTFTSTDFKNGGWVTVPDLKISTKPFEKLKIAQILLDVNYTFEPGKYFGQFYSIDSGIAIRIKDLTSDTTFDVSKGKTGQNSSVYTDTLINHWIGGLTNTANLQTLGPVGTYKPDACNAPEPTPTITEISHSIAGQVSINLDYNPNTQALLGTIDPINWKSTASEMNPHNYAILNVDRAFGGSNGGIDGGLVFGGISKPANGSPKVLDSMEVWNAGGFVKTDKLHSSVPRAFHIQGGSNTKTGVMVGGFSKFNTSDFRQFQEYGKSGVKDDMQVYIGNDDLNFTYFRNVDTFHLNTARGDAGGAMTVSVSDRQNKFQVKDSLAQYDLGKNGEQTLADFVDLQSGISDAKRYTTIAINGIIYGGSTTGKSYLTAIDTTDSIQSFERIKTVYVDVGITDDDLYTRNIKEVIADVMTINSKEDRGTTLSLKKCGKYRITYINGAGQIGNDPNTGSRV